MSQAPAPETPSSPRLGRTRVRVMRETLRMVAERGLGGTAVIDIEAAAGLSPGSGAFYRHFHSKEEALEAAVRFEIGRLTARQGEPGPRRPDLADGSLVTNGASPSSRDGSGVPDKAVVARELLDGLDWLEELSPLISVVLREGRSYPQAAEGAREAIMHGGMTPGLKSVGRAAEAAGRDPWVTAIVVTMATVGYHLAREFLRGPVEGIDAERFAQALADLVVTAPAS